MKPQANTYGSECFTPPASPCGSSDSSKFVSSFSQLALLPLLPFMVVTNNQITLEEILNIAWYGPNFMQQTAQRRCLSSVITQVSCLRCTWQRRDTKYEVHINEVQLYTGSVSEFKSLFFNFYPIE